MARTPVRWPPVALQSVHDAQAAQYARDLYSRPYGAVPWPAPDMEPPPVRASLMWAQGGRCYLCPRQMAHPTRDHVVPRGKGGGSRWNQLMACERCNVRKADRWPHPCELLMLHAVNLRISAAPRRGRRGWKIRAAAKQG
jgi:5-methylcytosine-specific restriction endonuclease McrA